MTLSQSRERNGRKQFWGSHSFDPSKKPNNFLQWKKETEKNEIVARPGKKETGSKKNLLSIIIPSCLNAEQCSPVFHNTKNQLGENEYYWKMASLNGQKETAKFHSDMKVALYGNLMCHAKFGKPHWVSSVWYDS